MSGVMTVADLIAELSRHDPALPLRVVLLDDAGDAFGDALMKRGDAIIHEIVDHRLGPALTITCKARYD